jgi:DNA-directed RNA polymerase specialized sigma24 family protein
MGLGDRIPFGAYVRSRGASLLRAAHALTGNRDDAEDLVQATLVKAYQSWDSVADPAAVDTYVRRVMINTHISVWRRHGGPGCRQASRGLRARYRQHAVRVSVI